MYPLIRVLTRSREDGKKVIRYALLKENHCRGFEQDRQLTVRQWMDSQGLAPYNENNDLMMDIISLKNQYMPGPLKASVQRLIYTMCYDIDALKDTGGEFESEIVEIPEAVKKDDEKLLRVWDGLSQKVFCRTAVRIKGWRYGSEREGRAGSGRHQRHWEGCRACPDQ